MVMFNMTSSIMMQRSSSSGSSSSSVLSLSPIGWNPSRSTISPPSITASPTRELDLPASRPTSPEMRRAFLSPEPARLHLSSPRNAYAFPSWPVRDSLTPTANQPSPTTCYFSPNHIPNSRISDSDLEALDFSTKRVVVCQTEEAVTGVSWSAINGGELVPALQVCERRRRLPPPPAQYRRRNSSKKSPMRKTQKSLVAITE